MATTLTALPARFNAGDTVKYTKSFADYPADDGWAATLYVAGAIVFNDAGAANGKAFDFELAASKTASVVTGANCATTSGSKTVTRAAGSFTTDGVVAGHLIHGPGIPAGTYVESVESATSLTISLAATATGASLVLTFRCPPGRYHWYERVTKAGETFTADEGWVLIDPDLISVPAGALQDPREKELLLLDTAINQLLENKVASYQIHGRAATYHDLKTLYQRRDQIKAELQAAEHPGRFEIPVRVRFPSVTSEAA